MLHDSQVYVIVSVAYLRKRNMCCSTCIKHSLYRERKVGDLFFPQLFVMNYANDNIISLPSYFLVMPRDLLEYSKMIILSYTNHTNVSS
jgi:hypothetical protein